MDPIIDPVRIKPAKLREFAYQAAWIATATEAANDLEELVEEVPAEGPTLPDFSTPWPWEFDSVALAVTVMRHQRDDAARSLEEQLARWLSEHPENWQLVRFLIDPWQTHPGVWREGTPNWLRVLGTIGATAYARYEPVSREPEDERAQE